MSNDTPNEKPPSSADDPRLNKDALDKLLAAIRKNPKNPTKKGDN